MFIYPSTTRHSLQTMLIGFITLSVSSCTTFPTSTNQSTLSRDTPMRNRVQVIQKRVIASDINSLFDIFMRDDVLPEVLTGYGIVPAVVSTSYEHGSWGQVGSERTVHLKDGSSVQEQITDLERPNYFAYRILKFDHPILKRLADYGQGQWFLTETPAGVEVEWRYSFAAKNRLASIPLTAMAQLFWRGYMKVCLDNIEAMMIAKADAI